MDDKFHTCRHCGIKDGEVKYNWVILSECQKCRQRIADKRDFENGKIDGKITRDNDIMCCKCGHIQDDDCNDWHRSDEWDCPECNTKHYLSVDFTTHFTTSLKERDEKT